jgi:hypothetical protein
MSIPILVEPSPAGFSATTGGPLDLSAEAASAAEAIHALQEKITRRLENGAILIEQPIQLTRPPIPILPLSENPLVESWLAAVETFRAEREKQESAGASRSSNTTRRTSVPTMKPIRMKNPSKSN